SSHRSSWRPLVSVASRNPTLAKFTAMAALTRAVASYTITGGTTSAGWAFQAAGFEVVDCPRLARMRNAADLRIALDAMELLAWPATRIDEFTLISTDSDFVPLLLRLRAADRRTKLVAHPEVGRVVQAAADELIGLDGVARWLGWQAREADRFGHDLGEFVLAVARDVMGEAQAPIGLPLLGTIVRDRTGHSIRETNWGGTGSWDKLLEAAGGLVRKDGPAGGYVMRREWIDAVSGLTK
ncbi:NYN domain-containing protein, partial [Roseomonas sp. GCM10028921]